MLAPCTCLYPIKLTETSIDKMNQTHQIVTCFKFMFKMFTIHLNRCTQMTASLYNRCHDDGVVQQPPLPQQKFYHIMDPWTVDRVLKDDPDAVVHHIQIWQNGWQWVVWLFVCVVWTQMGGLGNGLWNGYLVFLSLSLLLLLLYIFLTLNVYCVTSVTCALSVTEYPYLAADWQSSVKDRFYDEKSAEVIVFISFR